MSEIPPDVNAKNTWLVQVPVEILAERCHDQQADRSHALYCLEMVRRAVMEQCQSCWEHFIHQFHPQTRTWIRFKIKGLQPKEVHDLADEAFERFTHFFRAEQLAKAGGLGQVINYLRLCAESVATDWLRMLQHDPDGIQPNSSGSQFDATGTISEDDLLPEQWVEHQQKLDTIRRCVLRVAQNREEEIVATMVLLQRCKPAEVYAQYPGIFRDKQRISELKYALLQRLKGDPELNALYKNWPRN